MKSIVWAVVYLALWVVPLAVAVFPEEPENEIAISSLLCLAMSLRWRADIVGGSVAAVSWGALYNISLEWPGNIIGFHYEGPIEWTERAWMTPLSVAMFLFPAVIALALLKLTAVARERFQTPTQK